MKAVSEIEEEINSTKGRVDVSQASRSPGGSYRAAGMQISLHYPQHVLPLSVGGCPWECVRSSTLVGGDGGDAFISL